jgi:hypothetical protein
MEALPTLFTYWGYSTPSANGAIKRMLALWPGELMEALAYGVCYVEVHLSARRPSDCGTYQPVVGDFNEIVVVLYDQLDGQV